MSIRERESARMHVLRLVTGVAMATLLAACGGSSSGGGPLAGPAPGSSANPDPGVVHVHGLGIDPVDGTLYAATHAGLFRIPATGGAVRVAERFQDTMGFTVVGPSTFLGSGHPDVQKDPSLPPRLGLIRSTDAGESWKPISLLGKADFHALHFGGGRLTGWDSGSGALMVSTDQGETWETRSRLALYDFAVSPTSPDVILATTDSGLVRSTDGGRTFSPADGPVLTVLTWPTVDQLAGVDPQGRLQVSTDRGATWQPRGELPGPAEALTWDGKSMYAAVGTGIHASADGGQTWRVRYRDSATG